MTPASHRVFAAIIAVAAVIAALWLLLFVGPDLLNVHRDDAELLAIVLYVAVPGGLAWGGVRLKALLDPKDQSDD